MTTVDLAPMDSLAIARKVDALCNGFEEALLRGEWRRLDDWIPTEGPARLPALAELAALELERRLRKGDAATAEEYLVRFPELLASPALAAALLAAERQGRKARTDASCTIPPPPSGRGGAADLPTIPGASPHSGAAAARDAPACPVQVPGYEILSELGRGGMGVVYKAHDLDLNRPVALKVLMAPLHGDVGMERRFVEEAQVAGQLQHPGVAPVYKAGLTADRRPYFAMKLVKGRTLADLLAERPGPVDGLPQWLHIFEQVCQAVAYAHSHGVIHRDLKPANVMVGAFGEVQVMDWGLAKVLAGDGRPLPAAPAPSAVRTIHAAPGENRSAAGSVIGTLAYMPPEQARGLVDQLDARCDVFGLGAILCEIVTGAPPYRGTNEVDLWPRAAQADLADAFARLDGCGAGVELTRLARACLSAEPSARPADGGTVADQMAAYRAGVQEQLHRAELAKAAAQARAVEERKRRRLIVALAATVLLAVVGAGAAALWIQHDQSVRAADHARKAADTEREVTAALDEAERLAKQAQGRKADPAKWEAALAAALEAVKRADGVLKGGDGTNEQRDRVEASRKALEAAERDCLMVARLEEARFQEALAGKDQVFDTAGAAALYAQAFHDDDLDLESLDPAEAAARINQRVVIRDDLLAALADWSNHTPNRDDAQRLRRVLQAADRDPASFRNRWNAALAERDWDTLQVLAINPEAMEQPAARLATMGAGWKSAGGAVEVVQFLKQANARHPGDFWIAFQLAYASWNSKPRATDEAIRYYTAALMVRPNSAAAHNNLGLVLDGNDQGDEAITEYGKALKLQPGYTTAHVNLAWALHRKGRRDEAIAECRKAIEQKDRYPEAHYCLGVVLYGKGMVDDEAIAEYRKAIELKPVFPEAHNNLGSALYRKGQRDEAIAEYRKAIEQNPDYALAHYSLGNAFRDKSQWDEAITEYRKTLSIQNDYPNAHYSLGNALDRNGQVVEAIAEYRKALLIQPHDAKAHYNLGNALYRNSQWDEAIAEYREAITLKANYSEAHNSLGAVLRDKGRWHEAITAYRKALEIRPDDASARDNLGVALTLAVRDAALPAILRGEAAPSDAAEQVRFADFCQRYKRFNATASRFYADAFAAEPELAKNLSSSARFNAACAAALAGCGQGEVAATADAAERARWRNQALKWLRADLTLRTEAIDGGEPKDRAAALKALSIWQKHTSLAGVRDVAALAKLPPDEQDVWRQFWADVDARVKNGGDKK